MSKKSFNKKSGSGKALWIFAAAAVLILVVLLVLFLRPQEQPQAEVTVPSTETFTGPTETEPEDTQPMQTEPEQYLLSVDENIKIKEIGSYTGPYLEDGSNDSVENILRITVKNIGTTPVQYAKFALIGDTEEAVFELTTLLPGETMLVLEANRKPYTDGQTFTATRADNLAYFLYEPSVQEDILWVQPLDGGFNIRNISQEDITGKIVIYFKNYADGMYMGGITYSGTISTGLKAGEIKQIMSGNFSESGTRIVFINVG